jgi:hypothetical protein
MITVIDKVVEQLKTLPYEMQWRVFEFTRALTLSVPRGVTGKQLVRFAGTIPLDDVRLIQQTIEAGCEQVDANEW